jgi:ferredoxin
MTGKVDITLNINGRDHAISVEPRRTLADAIRENCGQTGTHLGCEHGVCGACTVIVGGDPVRSCLMFAVQADRVPKAWPTAIPSIRCSASSWSTTACNAVSARRAS